jgi:DNA polymerase III delta subunit
MDLRSLYVTLNELKESPCLLYLEVKDDFFREDCFLKYRDKWKQNFPDGEIHSCSAAELLGRKGDLMGGSLFGSKSLWILTDLTLRGKKNEEFISLLKTAHDHYFFIVESDPPSKALLELLKDHGVHLALDPIKPWERQSVLEGWIALYVKKQGKKIASQAASALAQAFPQERNALAQELDKLQLYTDEIQLKDVEALCSLETKTSSWNLLEAILSQDVKMITHALTYLEDFNHIGLLRFMRGQIEKFLLAENASAFRTKTQMKQYEQAKRLGFPRLAFWIKALEMKEVAIKSGESQGTQEDLLLLFLSFAQS